MSAHNAESVRVLTRPRFWGPIEYRPYLAHSTDQVHWGRVTPDYHGAPYFHTACGWSKAFNKFEMVPTDDSLSCKRCAAMRSHQFDGSEGA